MTKRAAKKPTAKKRAAASAKKTAGKKPAAKVSAQTTAVLRAAAAVDWNRSSGQRVDHIDKLLSQLVVGAPAAQRKAFDALHEAFVNRPLAGVVAPFLVELAIAGGGTAHALRLLCAAREAVASREDWRSSQRTIASIAPITEHIAGFLADSDREVRAAAAALAGHLAVREIGAALEREMDARVTACLLLALPAEEIGRATPYLDNAELGVAAAAACALARPDGVVDARVLDVLERALADEDLDGFLSPDRSLRADAVSRLSALTQPELRDRLVAIYTRLLAQGPGPRAASALLQLAFPESPETVTPFQKDVLRRCLTATEAIADVTIAFATRLGLASRVEKLRRIAGIREPVPAGSVFALELTIGQDTDSAYGFWKTYSETGEGDARAIVDRIAAALSPAEAAQAVLEASTLRSVTSFDGTMTPPPLPEGGVLGAKDDWESWTVYKMRTRSDVAAAYAKQLTDSGWHMIGFCDVPGDARIQAHRDGIQVEGTFYDEAGGTCANADAEPWLFAALVEALYKQHGKAFASAFANALRPLAADEGRRRQYGNLGYHVSVAAVVISDLSNEPPDPICDAFVARHQAGLNVLIAPHMKYLSLVSPERRSPMICTIVGGEGSFLALAHSHPTPEVLDAAAKGLRYELSSYRSGYDDASRTELARQWTFLGDRAVDAIQKAFKADKIGNPDIAATMLVEIGTPKARLALGKLAKHPDKKVQKLVQAALSS